MKKNRFLIPLLCDGGLVHKIVRTCLVETFYIITITIEINSMVGNSI